MLAVLIKTLTEWGRAEQKSREKKSTWTSRTSGNYKSLARLGNQTAEIVLQPQQTHFEAKFSSTKLFIAQY